MAEDKEMSTSIPLSQGACEDPEDPAKSPPNSPSSSTRKTFRCRNPDSVGFVDLLVKFDSGPQFKLFRIVDFSLQMSRSDRVYEVVGEVCFESMQFVYFSRGFGCLGAAWAYLLVKLGRVFLWRY